jgi:hypothetical protein
MICTPHHYCAGDKIEKNEMGETCSSDGEWRGVYGILVREPEGNRPLGKPRSRWEYILRWIFRKWDVGYGLD